MLIHKACSSHTSSGDNLCKLSPFTKYVSFIPLPVLFKCPGTVFLSTSARRIPSRNAALFLGSQVRSTGSKKGKINGDVKMSQGLASYRRCDVSAFPLCFCICSLKWNTLDCVPSEVWKVRASDLACSRFLELAGEKRFGVFVSHFQGYSATAQQEKVTLNTN